MTFRKTAVASLAVLSPLFAEFLLGDQYLPGPPEVGRQLGMFAMFVTLYGAGSVLIREVARRMNRGWPTIVTLALAYAVIEEGLLTQTLFNPHYLGLDLLKPAYIPWLGIGGQWTVYVLTLHVVWSIAAPIAIAEAFFGRTSWLRTPGLWAWSGVLVVGCVATFFVSYRLGHFIASPVQLIGAFIVAAVLVYAALRLTATPKPVRGNGWLGFAVGLIASTAFQVVSKMAHLPPWPTVIIALAPEAAVVVYAIRVRPPAVSLAAGAAVTYGWLGLLVAVKAGFAATVEQSVLVAATLILVATACRRRQAVECG
jgi:phosphoglycerol transferase MdoB-like AlkP superfamily enzyme